MIKMSHTPPPLPKRHNPAIAIAVIVGCFVVVPLLAVAASLTVSSATAPIAPPSSCKSDWAKCKSNADMVNNWSQLARVQTNCKRAAEKQLQRQSNYGAPSWPSRFTAFTMFYPGTDYTTGIITLIEPDVTIPNIYGTPVRTEIKCKYDLRIVKVMSIDSE
jgi:hypothetical protein